jgi:hypothetical protein
VSQASKWGGGSEYGWIRRLLAKFELSWWFNDEDWNRGRGGGAVVGEEEGELFGDGLRLGRLLGRVEGWCED